MGGSAGKVGIHTHSIVELRLREHSIEGQQQHNDIYILILSIALISSTKDIPAI